MQYLGPKSTFWDFPLICELEISKAALDDKYLKASKSDCFFFNENSYYAQNGVNKSFLDLKSILWIGS